MTFLKPYLMLACVAFMVGFVGYWAMGRALTVDTAAAPQTSWQAPVSTPAASDWNAPKKI